MNDYDKLIAYYRQCFNLVDCFHFNSEIASKVYSDYITLKNSKVIPITHAGIKDHRVKKSFDDKILRIGFIGNLTPYKGFPKLLQILDGIDNTKWDLSVWGCHVGKETHLPVFYKGKFNSATITSVYNSMDVLVVPSIWKETFSLVTLEALSYGVPVIVSNNVGAKDIVKLYDEKFVFNNFNELKSLLEELISSKALLKKFNNKLLEAEWCYSLDKHAQDIIDRIYID